MARNQAVEALRIASALGIIWYHANIWGSPVAYAGLVAFLIISSLFTFSTNRPLWEVVKRILVPWAIWMVLYAVFNVVRGRPAVPLDNGVMAGVLIGSGVHLWFLPFMAAFLSAVYLARRRLSLAQIAGAASVLLVLAVAMFVWWRPWSISIGVPVAQYAQALPAALLGAAWGALKFPERHRVWGLGLLALIAASALIPQPGGTAYTIGAIAVAIALTRPARDAVRANISRISGAMFGVYLIHLMVLWPLWPAIRAGFGIPAVLLAFIVSTAVVMLVKRHHPKVSRVVFGY